MKAFRIEGWLLYNPDNTKSVKNNLVRPKLSSFGKRHGCKSTEHTDPVVRYCSVVAIGNGCRWRKSSLSCGFCVPKARLYYLHKEQRNNETTSKTCTSKRFVLRLTFQVTKA